MFGVTIDQTADFNIEKNPSEYIYKSNRLVIFNIQDTTSFNKLVGWHIDGVAK